MVEIIYSKFNQLIIITMNKLKIGLITLGLMIAGVAGATSMLTHYVTTAGTANVIQAVTWGNGNADERTYAISGAGGGIYEYSHGNLKNNANEPVKIEFVTTPATGITVTYRLSEGTETLIPNSNNRILLPADFYGDFTSIVTFDSALPAGTYSINTSVNPVN